MADENCKSLCKTVETQKDENDFDQLLNQIKKDPDFLVYSNKADVDQSESNNNSKITKLTKKRPKKTLVGGKNAKKSSELFAKKEPIKKIVRKTQGKKCDQETNTKQCDLVLMSDDKIKFYEVCDIVNEFFKGLVSPGLEVSSLPAFLGQLYGHNYFSELKERFN